MKVSVIIPTLNSGSTIEQCIKSLFQQTVKAGEIIVVDGGSIDGTSKICQDLGIFFMEDAEGTVGRARNIGVDKTFNEIVLFLDSDCVASNTTLEYHIRSYENQGEVCGVMVRTGRVMMILSRICRVASSAGRRHFEKTGRR